MPDSQKKILLIEDEASIRKFLRVSLEANAFEVIEAANAALGISYVNQFKPHAIILDIGLPDMTGFEVISNLRSWTQTPIIVLTVQDREQDKVQALDLGADDYLTKPFSVPELLARLRVALRHSQKSESESSLITIGMLEINLNEHSVKLNGQNIKLTVTEFDILAVLAKHTGKVVTHRQLLKEVWGPHSVEHTQYLRVYLGQIRKKLQVNPGSKEFISTEPGVGYRLNLFD